MMGAGEKKAGGASVEIALGASIKSERHVQATEPEDVTREKAEALLRAIAPIVTAAGIVDDWLIDLRRRLQSRRIETLSRIMVKATRELEGATLTGAIPQKALLPILERASLEDAEDDVLTTAWAKLIASASEDYDVEVVVFSRLLSELSARECGVLRWLWRPEGPPDLTSFPMERFYSAEPEIKDLLRQAVPLRDLSVFEQLRKYVDPTMPMEFTIAYSRAVKDRVHWVDARLYAPVFADNELAFELLKNQGLIALEGRGYSWATNEKPVGVDWAVLTALGQRFMKRVARRDA
jgi:hypothetical protein